MSFTLWHQYFEKNRSHFAGIDWEAEDNLTPMEAKLITCSIQQFQKGENSEGKHLFARAKSFFDPEYFKCIKWFIREEQTHARILGLFMKKHGIPGISHHWVDGIFRWLRKFGGLENTITVLVTAEIIAKIYYKALQQATSSLLLQRICIQILKDEEQHIAFQCTVLNHFFSRKRYSGKFMSRCLHLILMLGTILVVWFHHRRVLKHGGYYFSKFILETLLVFFDVDEMICKKPASENLFLLTA